MRKRLLPVFIGLGVLLPSGDAFAANTPTAKHKSSTLAKKQAAANLMTPMKPSLDETPVTAAAPENNKTRSRRFLKEGARLHRLGEHAEAERLFKNAVALDPRNPDAFYNLGALAEGRGDLVDALTQYRAGLHLLPDDKALKEAVESMETKLSAGQGRIANRSESASEQENFRYPPTMFSNPNPTTNFREPPLLGVSAPNIPQVPQFSDPPPVIPANGNGPFQLSSTQNTAIGTAGSGGIPVYNVSNGSLPPTLNVGRSPSNGRRVAGAALNTALRVGIGAALSGTGLHCPACRWLRF